MPSRRDVQVGGVPVAPPGYFGTRFTRNEQRGLVWHHICAYLRTWIPADADVLELGAGWCDFSDAVTARSVTAVDVDEVVIRAAKSGVTAVVGDCTDLSRFADGSFDRVVASNLLEHLERPMAGKLLAEAMRVLRPGGCLVLIQPNFRLNRTNTSTTTRTHVAVYTDRSLRDFLSAAGWNLQHVAARFLPLSMKFQGSGLTFLVPWYLRSAVKLFAGQMLVVAGRPAGPR